MSIFQRPLRGNLPPIGVGLHTRDVATETELRNAIGAMAAVAKDPPGSDPLFSVLGAYGCTIRIVAPIALSAPVEIPPRLSALTITSIGAPLSPKVDLTSVFIVRAPQFRADNIIFSPKVDSALNITARAAKFIAIDAWSGSTYPGLGRVSRCELAVDSVYDDAHAAQGWQFVENDITSTALVSTPAIRGALQYARVQGNFNTAAPTWPFLVLQAGATECAVIGNTLNKTTIDTSAGDYSTVAGNTRTTVVTAGTDAAAANS